MLKEIFNEGLSIQKERIRELRNYAKEMRAKEDEARQTELDAVETHYNNQFEILADEMREQKNNIKKSQKESKRQLEKVKKTLRSQLESEIQELHVCNFLFIFKKLILGGNNSRKRVNILPRYRRR
jgi:centrosomal protein CEP95